MIYYIASLKKKCQLNHSKFMEIYLVKGVDLLFVNYERVEKSLSLGLN